MSMAHEFFFYTKLVGEKKISRHHVLIALNVHGQLALLSTLNKIVVWLIDQESIICDFNEFNLNNRVYYLSSKIETLII